MQTGGSGYQSKSLHKIHKENNLYDLNQCNMYDKYNIKHLEIIVLKLCHINKIKYPALSCSNSRSAYLLFPLFQTTSQCST